jgi:predicted nucleic acid-binding Zn ribbon protein
MIYTYRDEDGGLHDLEFPMGEAPGLYYDKKYPSALRRVFTAPGVQFKGGGFYSTGG